MYYGDKVRLIKDENVRGRILYIGYPESNGDEETIGIHLSQCYKKGTNGIFNGVKYFDVLRGYGYFAKRNEIEVYNKLMEDLKFGDIVILKLNRKGYVRYIGPVCSYSNEMIGVELDKFDPEAKDGRSKYGRKYFSVPYGRGLYVKRDEILKVIPV